MEGETSITQLIPPEEDNSNSKDISLNKEDKGNNSHITLLECLEADFSVQIILLVDTFDDICNYLIKMNLTVNFLKYKSFDRYYIVKDD